MKKLLLVLFVFIGFTAFSQETITSTQVKNFVGKEVILIGKVMGAKQTMTKAGEPMLLIDLDKAYPENDCRIIIFSEIISRTKFNETTFLGKTIKIKGKVGIFKEKPQIILENEANLTIEK